MQKHFRNRRVETPHTFDPPLMWRYPLGEGEALQVAWGLGESPLAFGGEPGNTPYQCSASDRQAEAWHAPAGFRGESDEGAWCAFLTAPP
jgi:hypothetical protein